MNKEITLTISDQLVNEAQALGQHESELEAIIAALEEYIQRHKQLEILELFGQVDYDPDYDYKAQRQKQ